MSKITKIEQLKGEALFRVSGLFDKSEVCLAHDLVDWVCFFPVLGANNKKWRTVSKDVLTAALASGSVCIMCLQREKE